MKLLFHAFRRTLLPAFYGRRCCGGALATVVALTLVVASGVGAQELRTDNIDGVHTVYAGDHYADCTGAFCFSGPNWGDNGESTWYVKVTFSQTAATYSGGSCFSNTVEYYDWNKLWGKARCGYTHNHQQDSDRFVWRRLQDLHTSPNCGNVANCTGIQIGTYSYDAGVTPYPNENWDLSKTFSTILQPDVPYILAMDSLADGTVLHSLYSSDWTPLESKENYHSNLCANYQQGTVLGLYFGGTCTAPQDVTVTYEAAGGGGPPSGPTGTPSKSPTGIPVPTFVPTTSPAGAPTAPPSRVPTMAPGTGVPTSSPSPAPTRAPVACGGIFVKEECLAAIGCEWVGRKDKVCQSVSNDTPAPTPVPGSCDPQGTPCSGTPNDCCSEVCGTKGKWQDKCK